MSPPAGPPSGGLYLNPPSSGGLWDGVTTTPSARSCLRPRFQVRIAWEIAGVGVYRRPDWIRTSTPCAPNTSSAVTSAGSERAWVSIPRKSGPVIPRERRCSTRAWLVARMWSSLKLPRSEEPRWPEVPKATRCPGSCGSGFVV